MDEQTLDITEHQYELLTKLQEVCRHDSWNETVWCGGVRHILGRDLPAGRYLFRIVAPRERTLNKRQLVVLKGGAHG